MSGAQAFHLANCFPNRLLRRYGDANVYVINVDLNRLDVQIVDFRHPPQQSLAVLSLTPLPEHPASTLCRPYYMIETFPDRVTASSEHSPVLRARRLRDEAYGLIASSRLWLISPGQAPGSYATAITSGGFEPSSTRKGLAATKIRSDRASSCISPMLRRALRQHGGSRRLRIVGPLIRLSLGFYHNLQPDDLTRSIRATTRYVQTTGADDLRVGRSKHVGLRGTRYSGVPSRLERCSDLRFQRQTRAWRSLCPS